jgi:hypothetical protein
LTTAALALIASAAPRPSAQSAAVQTAPATLTDLHEISELRARFNADAAFTRLLLLVSPT